MPVRGASFSFCQDCGPSQLSSRDDYGYEGQQADEKEQKKQYN